MENNFVDPETGEEFFFSFHRTIFRESGPVYTDKYNNPLVNPSNGNVLKFIEREKDYSQATFSILKSNDPVTRTKMLQERSKAHFKSDISEQKYEMNKKLVENFKGN